MSTYSFFQAHIQETLTGDSFMGHNTDNKVLPDCDTPVNANVEEELMTHLTDALGLVHSASLRLTIS